MSLPECQGDATGGFQAVTGLDVRPFNEYAAGRGGEAVGWLLLRRFRKAYSSISAPGLLCAETVRAAES